MAVVAVERVVAATRAPGCFRVVAAAARRLRAGLGVEAAAGAGCLQRAMARRLRAGLGVEAAAGPCCLQRAVARCLRGGLGVLDYLIIYL